MARPQWNYLWVIIPLLLVLSSAVSIDASPSDNYVDVSIRPRDDHHHHHAAPLLKLNETEVTLYHAPTPPSYWTIDIVYQDEGVSRYPGLMALHAIFMCMAFFVALPVGKLHL